MLIDLSEEERSRLGEMIYEWSEGLSETILNTEPETVQEAQDRFTAHSDMVLFKKICPEMCALLEKSAYEYFHKHAIYPVSS